MWSLSFSSKRMGSGPSLRSWRTAPRPPPSPKRAPPHPLLDVLELAAQVVDPGDELVKLLGQALGLPLGGVHLLLQQVPIGSSLQGQLSQLVLHHVQAAPPGLEAREAP